MIHGTPTDYGPPPHAVQLTAAVSSYGLSSVTVGQSTADAAWMYGVNNAAPPQPTDPGAAALPDTPAVATNGPYSAYENVALFTGEVTLSHSVNSSPGQPVTYQDTYYGAPVSFGPYYFRFYTPSCYIRILWNETVVVTVGLSAPAVTTTAKSFERSCPALANGYCLPANISQDSPLTWIQSDANVVTSDAMRPPDPLLAGNLPDGETGSVFSTRRLYITDLRWSCVPGYEPQVGTYNSTGGVVIPANPNGFPPNPQTGL